MAIITNNYKHPLGLPGGQVLPVGQPTEVPNFDRLRAGSGVVRSWLRAGVLSVQESTAPTTQPDPEAQPVAESETETETSERAELFAKLGELGIKPGGRTGTDKLRAMLQDAQAQTEPEA
jgi:hypothetical protein